MTNLALELRAVSQLYLELENELAELGSGDPGDARSYLELVARKRDALSRMSQVNSRAMRASTEWNASRQRMDLRLRQELTALADELQQRAVRLNDLCGLHTEKIRLARTKLREARTELGKGARFLQSLKPAKTNYPKFIDSQF